MSDHSIALVINGRRHAGRVDARRSLCDYLR